MLWNFLKIKNQNSQLRKIKSVQEYVINLKTHQIRQRKLKQKK